MAKTERRLSENTTSPRNARYCHLKQTPKPDRTVSRKQKPLTAIAPSFTFVIRAPGELPLPQIARCRIRWGRLSENTIKGVEHTHPKRVLSFEADLRGLAACRSSFPLQGIVHEWQYFSE
jgi:hypothetical protein